MSGRPVAERPMQLVTDTSPSFTRAATVYGWSLALAAVAAFVALLVAGAGLPPLVPTLLLLAVLALCIVRAVLYPSEFAVTAEVGVLLCAVVAFRDVAPYTGPLLIALFAGPLDIDHWRLRSFGPMAYNSGHRALGSLAAAGAFAVSVAWLGGSVGALAAATVLAALAASVVDGCASVALVTCLGANARVTRRGILETDAIAFPLAVAGGAIGFLATCVGWWAAGLALVGLALVPELLQARARIPARVVRDALLGIELVVALVAVAAFAPVPSWPTIGVLVAIAVVIGIELVVDRRVPVSPVLGVAVVAAAVALGGGAAVFAGALVGAVATATSWWCSGHDTGPHAVIAVALAACAGVVAARAAAFAAEGGVMAVICGIGAAVVFGLLALLVADDCRRAEAAAMTWTVPLMALALGGHLTHDVGMVTAPVASSAALAVAVTLSVWCGSTPWHSRVMSRALGAGHGKRRRSVLLVLSGVATLVAAAIVAADEGGREWSVWLVLLTGETANAMALLATRQWRFDARGRARDAAVLVVTGLALAVVAITGLRDGDVWAAAVIALLAGVVVAIGRRSIARADEISVFVERT